MAIHESGENYLEAILKLSEKQKLVRSIDIAREMKYSKPSVSRAVKKLDRDGFIVIQENGHLELTVKGFNRAKTILERHQFFHEFLLFLGIDQATAAEDACRMEHVLSDQSFSAIKDFVIKMRERKCKDQ